MSGLAASLIALCALGACTTQPGTKGEGPTQVGGGPPAKQAALLPGATCAVPDRFDVDVTIAQGCVVDITKNMLIENGSTLTIEPGVTLRFAQATYLEVGHKGSRLVAKGSQAQPIVFTSAAADKHPGDWVGLVFDGTVGESSIDHAKIEYAGRDSHGGQGAITVFSAFASGRVKIDDTLFSHNNLAGVSNRFGAARFASFDHNRFVNNARSIRVAAAVFVDMGSSNAFDDEVEIMGGVVDRTGEWPLATGGIFVSDPVYVNGRDDQTASLTIARGNTLRFAPKTWLEVGTTGPGALQAVHMTFTSAADKPKAGDWVGLIFGERSQQSRVADVVIEYAGGEEHGGDGAITFVGKRSWEGLDVSILFVTFRNERQSQISDNGEGCNKGLDPRNGNVFSGGVEPCR